MRTTFKIAFCSLTAFVLVFNSTLFAENSAVARKLINSQGCKACHTLEGDGGNLSVSFETMRQRLTRDSIRNRLNNPQHQHGNISIKDFSHLKDNELDALIEFIQPNPHNEVSIEKQ